MITLAVTGGIGSGKSAVCSILSDSGVPVYD
ncbi:MAG: dephospho-CoA kinase, partial [Candidatus Cryptobacteroides sp.]